jgi:hypothetical protein
VTKRIPNPFRTYAITLEGVPAALSEEMVRHLIEDAVKDLGTTTVVAPRKPKPATTRLRNRHIRKDGKIACTRTMTIGGKTIVGCGRVFATTKGYAQHMDDIGGTFADTARWPNHCLDAILPEDLRDTR